MKIFNCPNCNYIFEKEPSQKRKCPACKVQLFVIKDFYKVVSEEMFKVSDNYKLEPNRYSLQEEYNIYSMKWAILKSMWYSGLLINDKSDEPQIFNNHFFIGQIKGFNITIKDLLNLFDKFSEAHPFYVFTRIAENMIKSNSNDNFALSSIYTLLADLALIADYSDSFNYHKMSFNYKLKNKFNFLSNSSRPISEYKAVYRCFSKTCEKCKFLHGKLTSVTSAIESSVLPLENCSDGLCSSRIDFYSGENLKEVLKEINDKQDLFQ